MSAKPKKLPVSEALADKSTSDWTPTPLEIATLAAQFLPALDLKEEFIRGMDPLLREAQNLSVEFVPGLKLSKRGEELLRGEENPTPEELLCEAAVKRARTLLDAAGGKFRPSVIKEHTMVANQERQFEEDVAAKASLREEWQGLKKEADSSKHPRISLKTFLNSRLPSVTPKGFSKTSAEAYGMRQFYWNRFLEEYAEDVRLNRIELGSQEHGSGLRRVRTSFSEREFLDFAHRFIGAFKLHQSIWNKAFNESLKGQTPPDEPASAPKPKPSPKQVGENLTEAKKQKEKAELAKYGGDRATNHASPRRNTSHSE